MEVLVTDGGELSPKDIAKKTGRHHAENLERGLDAALDSLYRLMTEPSSPPTTETC